MSLRFPPLKPLTWEGGAGLANGFGGPVAPADNSALAEGDGGGKTAPGFCIGVRVAAAVACGDRVEPTASSSSSSFGICTVSLGPRGCDRRLFCLEGGCGA